MDDQRNVGLVRVDFDVLARLLQLPEHLLIEAAFGPPEELSVVLRIAGDGLPLVRMGERIPDVTAKYPIRT